MGAEKTEMLDRVRVAVEALAARFESQDGLAKAIGIGGSQLSNFRRGLGGIGLQHIVSIARLSGQTVDALIGRGVGGHSPFSPAELFELVAREAGLPEASIEATKARYPADGGRETNALRMLRFAEWHATDGHTMPADPMLAAPAPIAKKKRQAGRSK